MAVILGKRKRRADAKSETPARVRSREDSSDQDDDDDDTARALFQKAFEAKFHPLPKSAIPAAESSEEDSEDAADDDESDWSGISDSEGKVEVVEHALSEYHDPEDALISKKKFMSSKPPVSEDGFKALRKPAKPDASEDVGEAANMKNDLALQRLLKESHILDPSSFRDTPSTFEGKGRLKALDLRFQDLGAKASILDQGKMPLSHRRGIASKTASREASRRKEAAENGVILEKARAASTGPQTKRERGIGGPQVGKFRGGTLKLNSRDVASIQNSGSRGSGKKRGKR